MNQFELLNRFQEYLLSGDLKPGDKLPGELELAKMFNVSRGTIREIIIHLSLLGVLERFTRRGTFVCKADCVDVGRTLNFQLQSIGCSFEEMKAVRLMMEIAQVDQLLQYATPAKLEELKAINDEMALHLNNHEEADHLDLKFHLEMLAISGNRVLQVLGQVMVLMFEEEYREKFRTRKGIITSVENHAKMLHAIVKKDTSELKKLVRNHISPL